jgi:hypothetical protein
VAAEGWGNGIAHCRLPSLASEPPAARGAWGQADADAAGPCYTATHFWCHSENYSPQKIEVPFGIGHAGFAKNNKPNRKGPDVRSI